MQPQTNIIQFPVSVQIPSIVKAISPSGEFNPTGDDYTSSGRPKAKETDPLRSYTDYTRMKNHLCTRDAALLTIGIATGLRISDLLSLKIGHVIKSDEHGNPVFKEAIDIFERKTGKGTKGIDDNVFITEAVRESVSILLNSYSNKNKIFSLDDWLFQSKQPQRNEYVSDDDGSLVKNPLYGQKVLTTAGAHRSFKDAQRALNIPYNIGTHTMRKTFSCLYYIFSSTGTTKNAAALEDVQLALRHSNQRVTARYLGITKEHSRAIREAISDFLLGKSNLEEIKII